VSIGLIIVLLLFKYTYFHITVKKALISFHMSIVTVMAFDVELHFSTIAKETLHFGALVAWFSTIVIHITSQSRENIQNIET